jgi:hypothetical protein
LLQRTIIRESKVESFFLDQERPAFAPIASVT